MISNQGISSQFLIRQQLEAHYKKLQTVKSSIDNSVPFTLQNNSKSRIKKSNQIPTHPKKHDDSERHYNSSPVEKYANDPYVDDILRALLQNVEDRNISRSYITNKMDKLRPYTSSLRGDRCHSSESHVHSKKNYSIPQVSGDLLETKPNLFTSPKDFTPRMLKTMATSRIRTLDCYNPPKKNLSRSSLSSSSSVKRTSSAMSKCQQLSSLNKPLKCSPMQVKEQSFESIRRQSLSPSPIRKNLHRSADIFQSPSPHRPSPETMQALNQKIREQNKSENVRTKTSSKSSDLSTPSANPLLDAKRSLSHQIREHNKYEPMRIKTEIMNRKASNARSRQREMHYLDYLSSVTDDILKQGFFDDAHIGSLFRKHLALSSYTLGLDDRLRAIEEISQQLKLPESIYENIEKSSNDSCSTTHIKSPKQQFATLSSLSPVPPNSLEESLPLQNTQRIESKADQDDLDDEITPRAFIRDSKVNYEKYPFPKPRKKSRSPEIPCEPDASDENLVYLSSKQGISCAGKENTQSGDAFRAILPDQQRKSGHDECIPLQSLPTHIPFKSITNFTEPTTYDDENAEIKTSPILQSKLIQAESIQLKNSVHESFTAFTEVSSIDYTHSDYPYTAKLSVSVIETPQRDEYENDFCDDDDDDSDDDEHGAVISYI